MATVKRRAIRTATFDPVESHIAGKMLHRELFLGLMQSTAG